MSRFVGRSGEKRFSALCSDKGVTCNPANEDDHGWDHVIQFPTKPQPGVPADLQTSLPAVFVQTKTHRSDQGAVRMKLSNALALARSANPCFIVVPPGSHSRDENPWRAIHFWEEQIEKTLKRARKASIEGVGEDSLHKRWITFRLTDRNRQSSSDLLPWIEQTVKSVGRNYAAAKTSLLESVGFGRERLVGTIQFGPITTEELIDHQLGLTETIPIGNFEFRDRRFGLEIKLPIPTGPGLGTMRAQPRECQLRLRGPEGTELELESELIVSSLPGLPLEECKFRVKADFLDLVQSMSGKAQFRLRFNSADKRTPAQLEKLARVMSWSGLGEIDVQVWINDKRLFGGTADINSETQRAAFEELAVLINPLVQLSSNLRHSCPQISIEDVKAADHELVALHGFLTSPEMNVEANVIADASLTDIDEVVTYGFIDVGMWRFGALTRWTCAEQKVVAGMWKFKLKDRRIAERYAFESADSNAAATFEADFERLSAKPGVLSMDDNAVARLNHTATLR